MLAHHTIASLMVALCRTCQTGLSIILSQLNVVRFNLISYHIEEKCSSTLICRRVCLSGRELSSY